MEKLRREDYIHGGTQKDFYSEAEREYCKCPLCDADNYVKVYEERGLSVVRCKECSLTYVNPRAVDAEKNYFGDTSIYYNEAMLIFKGKKSTIEIGIMNMSCDKLKRLRKQVNCLM
ncbi:MAG: hypothetical protein NZ519_05650 [Bacteroidia bacterium]|nr:hypothetical protein [Bacteroidia bacterium]